MIKHYRDGEEFLFLGERYKLKIGNFTQIVISGSSLHFPRVVLFRAKKELDNWYRQQALTHITQRAEWYAARMQVKYASLSFADTKSRWGACTHDNRLQFNWRLIMTPHAVLDSVVVHELAHTLEKNHSKEFWFHVRKVMPGYSAHRAWINHHQDELFA
jgi:predicted metal-dependent hydrolase